jgi:hypothetical protein
VLQLLQQPSLLQRAPLLLLLLQPLLPLLLPLGRELLQHALLLLLLLQPLLLPLLLLARALLLQPPLLLASEHLPPLLPLQLPLQLRAPLQPWHVRMLLQLLQPALHATAALHARML